ncbi:hypothetical protein NMG60_11037016 [Bertholletia excelsa]
MRKLANAVWLSLIVILLAVKTTGRPLKLNYPNLVSDGVDDEAKHSFIFLRKWDWNHSAEECEQMYGFLPCSFTPLGHLFLIVRLFKILGPGIFGASIFHIIGPLPESLLLVASGLLNSKDTAQEYVYTGVGLLAGSTILLLTLIWGTCVIFASHNLSTNTNPNPSIDSSLIQSPFRKAFSILTGHGAITDKETSLTAVIMVLSVIPFIIIQIPKVLHLSSSGERLLIIITLVISFVFLLIYFFYQMYNRSMQQRRLDYVERKYFVQDILRYFEKHAVEEFLTEDGAPNTPAIRRIFENVDHDQDDCISRGELRTLLRSITYRIANVDKESVVGEVMKEFDLDSDQKITMDEFVRGFTKWLEERKQAMDQQNHSKKSRKDLYQILQPWFQKKRKEHEMNKQLISEMLEQLQSSEIGSLFREDGSPDIPTIKRLFENTDRDKDNCISQSELKDLIVNIKFPNISLATDEALERIMDELDTSRDQSISEEEFITGLSKLLPYAQQVQGNSTDEKYQVKENKEAKPSVEDGTVDRSLWARLKATMLLVVGIAVLAVLAEPLIDSVQDFSESASIPSFLISFILVPLATNARIATSAISTARNKKQRTSSLTFSEIYSAVFMNNILGFCVLLSLIYFRGLSWEFSSEVLVVLLVCSVMGITASFSSTFPIWTSIIAFLLYPLSLVLVYVLHDILQWS